MFTHHRLSPTNKRDCPHAIGTDAFSPQRAESFRHFLLLPSPPVVYHGRKPTNLRVSLGAGAAQFQAQRLRVRGLPEHIHLLLSEPQQDTSSDRTAPLKPKPGLSGPPVLLSEPQQDTLADALKSLKQGVSRRLIGEADHFWQKRYYDFNIRNYPQFVEKLRYIHRNPVKAGLCERPEDWEWSSFRHYATGCEGRVEIESEWTARKRERAAGRLCPAVERGGWPALAHVARVGFRKAES